MSQTPPETDEERCIVATNAAFSAALDECSTEALLSNLGRMVGLGTDPDPDAVPTELSREDCMDMEVAREWVAVRSHELIRDEEVGVSDAIAQAWDEATESCGW
jgi:hypothetical protein